MRVKGFNYEPAGEIIRGDILECFAHTAYLRYAQVSKETH
jgi:hypothetical protein